MIFFQFAKYSYDVWKFCHANEHDKDGMQMGMQGRNANGHARTG